MKTLACLAVSLMVCSSVFSAEPTSPNAGAAIALAEASPSLEETAAFVVRILKRQDSLKAVEFQEEHKALKLKSSDGNEGFVFLRKCDPEKVGAANAGFGVSITGTNEENVYEPAGKSAEGVSKYDFSITSQDDATRLRKALTHLIKLCGGKKSTF